MPYDLEPGMRSAEVRLSELTLERGQPLTYVFDFGEHWEVGLVVAGTFEPDEERYPRIATSTSDAPPQYDEVD